MYSVLYNRAGFRITTIHCDNEYKPLMDELEDVYGIATSMSPDYAKVTKRPNTALKQEDS